MARDRGDLDRARSLFEECLAVSREIKNKSLEAQASVNLGHVAYIEGDYRSARSLYRASLAIYRDLGNQEGVAACLRSFAALAVKEDRAKHASRLWGAAEALYEAIGVPLPTNEPWSHPQLLAAARQVLGDGAFEAAWAAGRAMTIEQAVANALGKAEA